jgi:hypothetical protein
MPFFLSYRTEAPQLYINPSSNTLNYVKNLTIFNTDSIHVMAYFLQ